MLEIRLGGKLVLHPVGDRPVELLMRNFPRFQGQTGQVLLPGSLWVAN